MTESTICLKPVSALLTVQGEQPANYWIRAYQRGYRWSPLQVTQLLDDIWDFIQESEGGPRGQFYCLQPLVVKVLPDGVIEVVDGQQRLTTLHIILTCLKDMASMLTSTFFRLTFETRDDATRPPLDPIDLDREMENVDYYHICQAYRAVQTWCRPENHPKQHQLKLLQHLLNDDTAGRNVKVIWFELGGNDDAVAAFTRLNVGKIPLTNDELIRALFLGRGRQGQDADDSIKVQIAYEWDLMEKELQAGDFWGFLTDQEREQNRIGFLFELMAEADQTPPDEEHDGHKVFYSFSRRLNAAGATLEGEWLKIKQEFMRLQEWFEDERRIAYHLVGFLVTQSVKLAEIRKLSLGCTKRLFDRRLRDRVFKCVMDAPAVPPEPELRTRLATHLDGLEYGRDSKKIRAILLLFNIATLLEHEKSNMRFQFDTFKAGTWDLEHVRSCASDKITDRAAWLTDCLRFLESQPKPGPLVPAIKGHLAMPKGEVTEEQFEELRHAILERFGEADDEEERNNLANLTLLDSRTNRSYKNAPFAVKRQKILSLDKAGIFIPLCTRNVFLKCYSEQPGDSIFWKDKEDGEAYQNAILETLVGFFLGREVAR